MGVIYIVIPLDAGIAKWLDDAGIYHPPFSPAARSPTPNEIFAAIEELSDCRYEVRRHATGDRIYLDLKHADGRWTEVNMSNVVADDRPCDLSFHKGFEALAAEVLSYCTAHCGPLVLWPDTGDEPVVVPSIGTQ
jgi:hypothetical protein